MTTAQNTYNNTSLINSINWLNNYLYLTFQDKFFVKIVIFSEIHEYVVCFTFKDMRPTSLSELTPYEITQLSFEASTYIHWNIKL